MNSSQALKFSGRQLGDWGFHQHEIVTDKVIQQEDTIWNVEEHRYTKSTYVTDIIVIFVAATVSEIYYNPHDVHSR